MAVPPAASRTQPSLRTSRRAGKDAFGSAAPPSLRVTANSAL